MDEPLKITIDDLDEEATAATDSTTSRLKQKVGDSLKDAGGRAGRKAAGVAAGAAVGVAGKGVDVVREQVIERAAEMIAERAEAQARETAAAAEKRLRETDWQVEAQKGAAKGLKWLSARIASLSERPQAPADKSDSKSSE